MSKESWEELGIQHEEHLSLRKEIGKLRKRIVALEAVAREQGCPNWGDKDGISGPCYECAYCRAFLEPQLEAKGE